MNKIKYFLALVPAILALSCVDDPGNYEYDPINEIELGNFDTSEAIYTLQGFGRLKIDPQVEMSVNNPDDGIFDYYWLLTNTDYIDTIGTSRLLDWAVDAPIADGYQLRLRIENIRTGVIYNSDPATVHIGGAFSRGIMLIGENSAGFSQVQMLGMVEGDTLFIENLFADSGLPDLRGPVDVVYTGPMAEAGYDRFGYIWYMTEEGSYFVDRNTLESSTNNTLYNWILDPDGDIISTSPATIAPRGHLDLGSGSGNGRTRAIITRGGDFYFAAYYTGIGSPIYIQPLNRDSEDSPTYRCAPYIFYTKFSIGSALSAQFVTYDMDNERFVYMSGYGVNLMKPCSDDADNPPFLWQQTNRTFRFGENTKYTTALASNGISYAIMPDRTDYSDVAIYEFTVSSGATPGRLGNYQVSASAASAGLGRADMYTFANKRGIVFFVADNQLYGYEFHNHILERADLGTTDEITMIYLDKDLEHAGNYLYVATYNASTGGTLSKYQLVDNNSTVTITPALDGNGDPIRWTGLVKIKNMSWRE